MNRMEWLKRLFAQPYGLPGYIYKYARSSGWWDLAWGNRCAAPIEHTLFWQGNPILLWIDKKQIYRVLFVVLAGGYQLANGGFIHLRHSYKQLN